MNLVDFSLLPDIEKLIVFEVQPKRELQEKTWSAGSGSSYYHDFDYGEVVKVTIDGVELTEKFSSSDCGGTASTFYYDDYNKRLYVHTPDSDSPAALSGSDPKYVVIAFFYIFISNRPKVIEREDDNILVNGRLEFWISSNNIEDWSKYTQGTASVTRESTIVYDKDSAYSVKLAVGAAASAAGIYQTFYLPAQRKARVRFKYYCVNSTSDLELRIKDTGSNVYLNSSLEWQAGLTFFSVPDSVGAWAEYEIEFIVHESYTNYEIYIRETANGAFDYIDNVEVRRVRQPIACKPYLPGNSVPLIRHSVGDYYIPDEQIQFGTIRINNPGYFWTNREEFLWHNLESRLLVGEEDSNYEDMMVMVTGVTRRPRFGHVMEFDVKDKRALLQKIPITRFDSTNYPNVETAWENKAIPILLGTKENITPPCSDTTNYTYKFTQTVFNGDTYPAEQLTKVYKDGVLQTVTTHYTVNLNAGTFTMVSDPGSSVITCDAIGLQVDDPAEAAAPDDYAYSPANFLWFIYVIVNNISKYKMNVASLIDLHDVRTIIIGDWICEETDSIDFLIKIKKSGIFQSYVNRNGLHSFWAYAEETPDDTLRFYNQDYKTPPVIEEPTDQCFKEVIIKKDQDPTTGAWEERDDSDDSVEWKYDIKDRIEIETLVYTDFQSDSLAENYLEMLKNPVTSIRTTLPRKALALNPADKVIFSYSIKDDNGDTITILGEVVFRILSLEKNVNTGEVRIYAIEDVDVLFWLM